MGTKERISMIRLSGKLFKHPEYAKHLGIEVITKKKGNEELRRLQKMKKGGKT